MLRISQKNIYYYNDAILEPGEVRNPFFESASQLFFYNQFKYLMVIVKHSYGRKI